VKKCPLYIVAGLIIGTTASTTAHAQVRLDATTGVYNHYVFPDLGFEVDEDPIVQGILGWTLPYGTWTNIYWNTDLELSPGPSREVDYAVGWSNDHLIVGIIYFDLHELFGLEPIGDMVEGLVEGSYTWKLDEVQKIRAYTQANYLYATKDPSLNSGAYPLVGATHTWNTKRFVLQSDVMATYDFGIFQSDSGIMGRVAVTPTIRATDWLAFGLPLRINSPLSSSIQDREPYFTFGGNFTLSYVFIEPPPPPPEDE
jgi:hypothetical protein